MLLWPDPRSARIESANALSFFRCFERLTDFLAVLFLKFALLFLVRLL